MYFKRLEMHGFKSFAEPVVIEFHEGVTCIVGPNGSGKSNISDAIRWVLGEQSPKMLRGGKMEEVIFAGTASRKSRGMAEVTLVIDNSLGILPIDYNEVAITRRMYRSGESEYLINNNACRLRDIRELIMDTGIGVDGYSLIGQGKIADIVSSKAESRREIFEEAAGVVLYKSKKAEAERKLSATNANLERADDIISEIEGRIDGLREDSAKAKEYLQLKERYQELEINIALKSIDTLEQSNEALKNDVNELKESIDKSNEEKDAIDDELTKSRKRNTDLETFGNDARDQLIIINNEISDLNNEATRNEERLGGIERDFNRINGEIEDYSKRKDTEQGEASKIDGEMRQIGEQLQKAVDELNEKKDKYADAVAASDEYSEIIDKAKENILQLRSQINEKGSDVRTYENFQETLEKRRKEIVEDQAEIERNAQSYDQRMREAKAEKSEADDLLETLRSSLNEAKADRESYTQERAELAKKWEDLRTNGTNLSARKTALETLENNYDGYNSAVRFIMRHKTPGIRGVVADLIDVPTGYEVAIETALGAGTQNIVCDSDEDAKAAVRALKENRAGRCTFLPIRSVRSRKADVERRVEQIEGYLGLAVDLISFDSEYEGVFNYLLGRVAIVDNLDNAVSLSKIPGAGGLRFVTLDGEVINTSGAITGGKFKNNTANLLERKQEISQLDAKIKQLRDEIRDVKERIQELDDVIEEMQEVISDTERDFHQAEIQSGTLDTRIKTLEESGQNLNTGREKAERELAKIQADFDEAQGNIERLNGEISDATEQIQKINDEAEQAVTALEAAKNAVSDANEEVIQAGINQRAWEGKLDTKREILDRVNKSIENLQREIDNRQQQIQALEQEKNDIIYGSEDAADQAEAKEQKREELSDYIEEVRKEREALSEAIDKLSNQQTELGNKLNDMQDKKYQLEIKIGKNDTQLDNFKTKLWDEFEVSYIQAMEYRKADFVMSSAQRESREVKLKIRRLGDVNVGAIKEYEEVNERYTFLTEQRADILRAMDELKRIIRDMDKTIRDKFKESFDQIVVNFEEIFRQLFGGGHAELRLDDENNPLESGIEIIAQPPGKKLQNINLMSGGEKTMTAIALMFAVLKTKPTPFCILDEVEAALDDANIDRFANYLREFDNIQFAIVTHQKATMEHADVLYGVTMPEQGISKVLSLRLGDNFEV